MKKAFCDKLVKKNLPSLDIPMRNHRITHVSRFLGISETTLKI